MHSAHTKGMLEGGIDSVPTMMGHRDIARNEVQSIVTSRSKLVKESISREARDVLN